MKIKEIDAVLLCGGQGRRLRSIISDRPKPMALVNGRAFLDFILDYLAACGFRRFILATGYMSDIIKQAYENRRLPYEIVFSPEKKPLDTAGAVKNAEAFIKSQVFMVANADSFCSCDFDDFLSFHLSKKAMVSIALANAHGTKDVGLVRTDESARITNFLEKKGNIDKHSLVNAGIYLFNHKALSLIPKKVSFSLEKDLFPSLDRCFGYSTNNPLIDIGTPEGYQRAKLVLRQSQEVLFKKCA